jgi:hypothetical protein
MAKRPGMGVQGARRTSERRGGDGRRTMMMLQFLAKYEPPRFTLIQPARKIPANDAARSQPGAPMSAAGLRPMRESIDDFPAALLLLISRLNDKP